MAKDMGLPSSSKEMVDFAPYYGIGILSSFGIKKFIDLITKGDFAETRLYKWVIMLLIAGLKKPE
jgi:hypothetical protein